MVHVVVPARAAGNHIGVQIRPTGNTSSRPHKLPRAVDGEWWEEMDARFAAKKFPVIRLKFPVLQKKFPDNLLREFAEKSLRHSGFLLWGCRLKARNRDFPC
jgi:hypothetical protein